MAKGDFCTRQYIATSSGSPGAAVNVAGPTELGPPALCWAVSREPRETPTSSRALGRRRLVVMTTPARGAVWLTKSDEAAQSSLRPTEKLPRTQYAQRARV